MNILENYNRIKKNIEDSAVLCGRDPGEIKIIAISKTFPDAVVQQAIDAGITLFGENKVQEAKEKIPRLKGDVVFHMVGHLQSNKARDAVKLFDLIHSIDKLSTAQIVDAEAERIGKSQKILIQINTSGENSKSGARLESALELVKRMLELTHVNIQGLMAMAPFTDDVNRIRDSFRKAKQMLEEINIKMNQDFHELSMGMSSDYQIAVTEGATLVRIGAAIFGSRTAV